MLKLKYNWVGGIVAVFLPTIVAVLSYNSIINRGLFYLEENGGSDVRKMIEANLAENTAEVYWKPYLYMFILVLIYMILAFLINFIMLRKNMKFIGRLLTLMLFSCICSGVLLGSIEPYIARDAVEYGVRQELNQVLEIVGYTSVNFYVYLIPLIGAIALAFFTINSPVVDEQTV